MQMYSTTGGDSSLGTLSDFLRDLLQRNLDRVLAANQPVEPTKQQMSKDAQALVLLCSESVKAMAWKFARRSSRVNVDEMYSVGMLAVCEAVPHLAEGTNPFPYLRTAARYAMIDEYRRMYDCSVVSLDAPLSNDSEMCLVDLLPSPAPAALAVSKRSQALHGAMRRLASARQRAVLRRRYGLPGYGAHSMKEAARSLHTSLGVINNADRRGLRNLRADARLCEVVGVSVSVQSAG
jgi:DNA-directed RNA polymerase specialized sigma24 family protein